jgi:hypothetical protein
MGVDSEELLPTHTFEVKGGEAVIFGGQERLPKRFLELTLNNRGNLRIKRLEGKNEVTIWGQDRRQKLAWEKFHLVEELTDKEYERIDGGSLIIDIAVPRPDEKSRLLRLNEVERASYSRAYRAELNPKDRDLRQGN